jgi:hypothetical protein
MVTANCKQCGGVFYKYPSQTRKYCCRKCSSDNYRGKTYEERYGEIRGAALREGRSRSLKNRVFSEETKLKMRRAKSNVSGEMNNFYGKKHSEDTKKKIRAARLGREPWNKGSSRTPNGRMDYRLSVWSKAIINRDGFMCQECQASGGSVKMQAHHIMSYNDFPDERYDMANGVCLCEKCHHTLHRGKYRVVWIPTFGGRPHWSCMGE